MIRALALAMLLAACGPTPYGASYHPSGPPASWCRLAAGAYAFLWLPTTVPSLVGAKCEYERHREQSPPVSTLAQLVVEPGSAIEIPVLIPETLDGCTVDSLVVAHGRESADVALDLRAGPTVTPIVRYAKLPANLAGDQIVVFDRPRPPAPSPPPAQNTNATNGVTTEVTTEVTVTIDAGIWQAGATLHLREEAADQPPVVAVEPSRALEFVAIRHRIAVAAPLPRSFVLVLRAQTQPFTIAVRSDRESGDPVLGFRTADHAAVPTHFVPQAAVIVTGCSLPARQALDSIRRGP